MFVSLKQYSPATGHYLFAGVVLVRLLALAPLSKSPFLLPARGDMHFYNDWAQRILRGELTDHLAFYGLPLYAYLLAFFYKLFGYSPFVPAFLQSLLDGGTAVLIYQLTLIVISPERAANRTRSTSSALPFFATHRREIAGVCAGLGWAFFVPAQAFAVILMPTAWLVFLFWFVVWRIVKTDSAPSSRECLILGLLIGFTAMGVATILFLIPLILAALFFKPGKIDNRARAVSAGAALLLLGAVVGTSPCWIHNHFIAHDPVFLSAHSGINFWIGNNPDANGYPRFPPGLRAGQAAMLEDSITAAESAAGHSLKRAQVSAFWSTKAEGYIAQHFFEWLKLLATKLRNFWSAFQYDDLSIITILREHRIIFPGLYFGLVAALGLPGIFLGWRWSPRSRWIAAAIFLHMCALIPVFVTERYRLPVVPGLLVFAALGLSILWESCVAADVRRVVIYFTLLVTSTIIVSWPQQNPSLWALDAYNSGWQALESNNYALAEKKLFLARAYVPDNSETNFALGELRQVQGQMAQAKHFYAMTLALDPKHKGALNNLGVLALQENRLALAQKFFNKALEREPRNAKTHFQLAKTAVAMGDFVTAENEIAKALEIAPDQPEFLALQQELRNRARVP